MAAQDEIARLVVGEIANRAARLRLYARASISDAQDVSATTRTNAARIIDLAYRIFEDACGECTNSADETQQIEKLFEYSHYLACLESSTCTILPFKQAPPEIKRFMRFLDRNVLVADQVRLELTVSASKTPGNSITISSSEVLDDFELTLSKAKPAKTYPESETAAHTVSIELSALDWANPIKWPIATHEISHHIYASLPEEQSFISYLRSFFNLTDDINLSDHFGLQEVDIEAWIKEIWCDCLAAYLLGPIVYYTQFQTFLQSGVKGGSQTHPGGSMRLYILETFLRHRHKSNFPYAESKDYIDVILAHEKDATLLIGHDPRVTTFTNKITRCILSYFPDPSRDLMTPVASKYENIPGVVSTTNRLNIETVNELAEKLFSGLPVPSINGEVSDTRATALEEIFYAGWKCSVEQIRKIFDNGLKTALEETLEELEAAIATTNERILSSLQVSEWVRGLISHLPAREVALTLSTSAPNSHAVLGFNDIGLQIREKRLQVIPLIDGRNQIGRCSLDLRLGTSFELLSDSRASIDFLSDDSSLDRFTTHHELDYLESITISPGQFVLGHTMEYLMVPPDLCGHLEGRSSFARVGLLIHLTAGFLEAGYRGSVTLEIYNIGTAPIVLYPGYRVCQLRFLPVGTIPESMFAPKRYEQRYGFNRTRKSLDIEPSVISRLKSN